MSIQTATARSGSEPHHQEACASWHRTDRRSQARSVARSAITGLFAPTLLVLSPTLAFAQANVFEQGATNFITELTLFAAPFAILAVMALGILAAIGRISWGWPAGVLFGIALLFGAPQIVGWVRAVFVV